MVGEANGVDLAAAERAWVDLPPFEIAYRDVNCFHGAAVVEAHTDGVPTLVDRALPHVDVTFLLPHMSVGYFRRVGDPDALRDALEPLRELDLGIGIAREIVLCDVPIAKTTVLQPWTVLGSIQLASRETTKAGS